MNNEFDSDQPEFAQQPPKAQISEEPSPSVNQESEAKSGAPNALELYNIPSRENYGAKSRGPRHHKPDREENNNNNEEYSSVRRRIYRKRPSLHRNDQPAPAPQAHHAPYQPSYNQDEEVVVESKPIDLESLSPNELMLRVRRLEAELMKEQSRRESAEKMAIEAKSYAEILKAEIGDRIADIRETMEATQEQLRIELREAQARADSDLKYYRDQLDKANQFIAKG